VFWGSTSIVAQPARGISSVFSPNARDDQSNSYRDIENLDLGIDIRQSMPLGLGFGRPIPHPVPLTFDANSIDPLIDYVPHNSILYIWLRTGFPGILAFLFVVGAATVMACRIIRCVERRLSLLGMFGLWTLVAYVFAGWFDAGLVQYRTAVFVGCVLGALEAASRITSRERGPAPTVP
jgi:hypothetical protein